MHLMVLDGSVTMFSTVFFTSLLLPCTVTNVMTIADPPGWIVGL